MDRNTETKLVKTYLKQNGYTNARVGHGAGWLDISLGNTRPVNHNLYKLYDLIKDLTGRRGDYNGYILIEN
jgi:hypothetical protein